MARFRKIDDRIWNDRKFRELNDQAKLAFILLLTPIFEPTKVKKSHA